LPANPPALLGESSNWFWVGAGSLVAGLLFAFAAAGLIHLGVRSTEERVQP
jgi:hypothetical protein